MTDETFHWYKGSLHNHTNKSDGDSSPAEVIQWYRRHLYHFAAITDHNVVTPIETLSAKYNEKEQFLVLPGEEITDIFPSPEGVKPIHVNALGITRTLGPEHGMDAVTVLQRNVDSVRAAGGLPMVNHPNYRWALTTEDIMPITGFNLFEFANCGAAVNNTGIDCPGTEEIWDTLLTGGKRLWGVASDDSHHFTAFSPRHDNPGRGWVMVRGEKLSPETIYKALEKGDFYSTTGVILEKYEAVEGHIAVKVQQWGYTRHRIEFIGPGGRILFTESGTSAEYRISGSESYVRVRVTDSNNLRAWTQPVFLKGKN
jgi:hypothetical protein